MLYTITTRHAICLYICDVVYVTILNEQTIAGANVNRAGELGLMKDATWLIVNDDTRDLQLYWEIIKKYRI